MGAAVPVVATLFSVGSTLAEGNRAEDAAERQAEQLRAKALQDQAVSQVDAREERKRAEFLASKLIARAGASGTAIDSPGISKQIAEIDEKGAYNALAALYAGKTSARSKRLQAREIEKEGKSAKKQSRWAAGADILTAGSNYGWFSGSAAKGGSGGFDVLFSDIQRGLY